MLWAKPAPGATQRGARDIPENITKPQCPIGSRSAIRPRCPGVPQRVPEGAHVSPVASRLALLALAHARGGARPSAHRTGPSSACGCGGHGVRRHAWEGGFGGVTGFKGGSGLLDSRGSRPTVQFLGGEGHAFASTAALRRLRAPPAHTAPSPA